MSQTFVQSFEHLEDRPHADKALETLKRVASLVKPIMRKRGWILPVLGEFFPDDMSLLGLNVNRGQKILLRLRPYHTPDWFYPLEDLIGTMLHELTHNVHGPHDEKFYKYLDGLQDEYDELQRTGYAGEGFYTPGRRLGENVSHNVPQHLARLKALEAAEKRSKVSAILSGGGKRLGSATRPTNLSPRELAARAVEKRMRDDKACGSAANPTLVGHESKTASTSRSPIVIDLTLSDEEGDSADPPRPDSAKGDPNPSPNPPVSAIPQGATVARPPSSLSRRKQGTLKTEVPKRLQKPYASSSRPATTGTKQWACSACTLLNTPLASQCDACGEARPVSSEARSGWDCLYCGQLGVSHALWTCTFCGQVKLQS